MKKIEPIHKSEEVSGQRQALEIIKRRIRELYDDEPEDKATVEKASGSLMDRFWEQHKDSPDSQAAWQQFYSGLSDDEKLSLWDEYHGTTSHFDSKSSGKKGSQTHGGLEVTNEGASSDNFSLIDDGGAHSASFEPSKKERLKGLANKESLLDKKEQILRSFRDRPLKQHRKSKGAHHWVPFFISLVVGLLFLFAQYNQVILALAKQYVSPGDSLRSPVIIDPNADVEVGNEARVIIPKINVDVPVVYDIGTKDEQAIQAGLERGVVHYAGTGVPGQSGNNVIVGHSSNNFLNSGKYKFAFVLLDRLEVNDTFVLHYKGTRYVYKITNKQVIEPTDFSLTLPTQKPTATLITCTPPGTSWRRLVVQGEQISPSPSASQIDKNPSTSQPEESSAEIVPGNAPSLWSRFTNWLF